MPDLSDESPSPSPQTNYHSPPPVSSSSGRDPLTIDTPTATSGGLGSITSLGGGGESHLQHNSHHNVPTSSLLIPDYSYAGSKGLNSGVSDFSSRSTTYQPHNLTDYLKPSDNTFRPFLPATANDPMTEDPYKLAGVGGHTDWHSSLYSTYPPHHPPPKLTLSPFICNYLHSGY